MACILLVALLLGSFLCSQWFFHMFFQLMCPWHLGLRVVELVPILLVEIGYFLHSVPVVWPSYAYMFVANLLRLASTVCMNGVCQTRVPFGTIPWGVLLWRFQWFVVCRTYIPPFALLLQIWRCRSRYLLLSFWCLLVGYFVLFLWPSCWRIVSGRMLPLRSITFRPCLLFLLEVVELAIDWWPLPIR